MFTFMKVWIACLAHVVLYPLLLVAHAGGKELVGAPREWMEDVEHKDQASRCCDSGTDRSRGGAVGVVHREVHPCLRRAVDDGVSLHVRAQVLCGQGAVQSSTKDLCGKQPEAKEGKGLTCVPIDDNTAKS